MLVHLFETSESEKKKKALTMTCQRLDWIQRALKLSFLKRFLTRSPLVFLSCPFPSSDFLLELSPEDRDGLSGSNLCTAGRPPKSKSASGPENGLGAGCLVPLVLVGELDLRRLFL